MGGKREVREFGWLRSHGTVACVASRIVLPGFFSPQIVCIFTRYGANGLGAAGDSSNALLNGRLSPATRTRAPQK